jgi:hypothetical protein
MYVITLRKQRTNNMGYLDELDAKYEWTEDDNEIVEQSMTRTPEIAAYWKRRIKEQDEFIASLTSADMERAKPRTCNAPAEGTPVSMKDGKPDEEPETKSFSGWQLRYLEAYTKCQDGNPHPDNPLPEAEDLKGCPPECQTEAGARFLWEHSVIKTQGDCETVGWITIWQVISFRHTECGQGDPRLAVILSDHRTHGRGRYNDISDTPVGRLLLAGWKAQYPDVYADLPRTHAEMVRRIKELSRRVMIEEIEEAGISTTGLSDDELFKKSGEASILRETAWMRKEGYSEEQIEEHFQVRKLNSHIPSA